MMNTNTNNQISDDQLNQLAASIATQLRLAPQADEPLWDAADCAGYLKVSRKHFVDRIANIPGFPKRVQLPTAEGRRGHPRWFAKEVVAWLKKR